MDEFVVPSWVVTFMPLVVLVVTFLVGRLPALSAWGPRNIGAAVACILAAVVIALDPPVVAGANVMEYVAGVIGVVMYWWKGAQLVYDLFTGQIETPEGHATSH